MKTVIHTVFLLVCLFFVSCSVKAPELVVVGVQAPEALSFLEQYQAGKKEKKDFNSYIQQVRVNYAPGFEWDQYWSGIEKKRLYKNLEDKELYQLFSLNKISCERKNWGAFSNLILQIAKSENKKLLFSEYLTDLQRTCFTWLPNPSFKAILQFLSDKRGQEAKTISAQHYAYRRNKQNALPKVQSKVGKYTYTEELKKILSDERSRRYTARNWDEVLEAVNRDFWIDVRWISYQSKNKNHLRNLLEIEWNTYKSIRYGLNMDVLLMFEEKNKMEDIIRLAKYEKYFSDRKSVNWPALWRKVSLQYPVKPNNGNVEVLLSLYKYSSCRDEELFNYMKVINQWKMYSQGQTALGFCDDLKRKQLRDFVGSRGMQHLSGMAEKLYEKVLENAKKEAHLAGEEVKNEIVKNILKDKNIYHLLEAFLMDGTQFKDRVGLIKEFREKEWDRLVQFVHANSQQLNEVLNTPFVWWLARILFLYSEESDDSIKKVVSQLSGAEWNSIITGLLNSYVSRSSLVDNYLFDDILHKVKLVYSQEVETSLCSFFSKEEGLFLVREYEPKWLIDLLGGLSWSERQTSTEEDKEAKGTECAELVSKQKRNTLLYELSQSLFKQKTLERKTDPSLRESLSDVWSVAVQIMDLSVKVNDFQDSPVWHLTFNALTNMKEETNNYDFFVEFFKQIQEQLLFVAKGDKDLVLNHLNNDIWKEPPATPHHKTYRDWLEEILGDRSEDGPSTGGKHILPQPRPPSFGSMYRPQSQQLFFGQTQNEKSTSNFQKVSFFFYNKQASAKKVLNDQGMVRSLPLIARSDYGQIFIQETSTPDDFDFKISVLGGVEIGSPYISSYFVGFEAQYKIHSLIYLGLDYSFYISSLNSVVKDIKNTYMGMDVSYPFLKHTAYFNGYYHIFKSHLNLAGLYTIKLSVPLQIGLGIMGMEENKIHPSTKWGIGPHIQLSPRWGVQFRFHQTASIIQFQSLYTWSSFLVTFKF